jgi:D-glycero-D-manno-heptose 1,7-bisphosphate phosphatase
VSDKPSYCCGNEMEHWDRMNNVVHAADRLNQCMAEFPNAPEAWSEYAESLHEALCKCPGTRTHAIRQYEVALWEAGGLGEYQLVIFDADGTLVRPKSGKDFREHADDWELLPGRLCACQGLKANGVKLAIASNQGGVAFGYLAEPAIRQALHDLGAAIGAHVVRFCPFHPDGTLPQYRCDSSDRKPSPGMLQSILLQLAIRPEHTLFVGDRSEDEGAAKAAGVHFQWADKFFAPFVIQETLP